MNPTAPIVVAGAGSVGCFVGGLLATAGRDVALLARRRVMEDIAAHGLHLTDLANLDIRVSADAVRVTDDPTVLREARVVLVTVKSRDTAPMAELIARHASADAPVVSLQNGVANADALRAALPGRPVIAGMVPFNVLARGEGRFHRGTTGSIVVDSRVPDIADSLAVPNLPVEVSADMAGVLWGKLLFNLNNALNALSGLPLRDQLQSRPWRRLLAAQIAEALGLLARAGIVPHAPAPLPVRFLPTVLRLPTWLFARIASRTLAIDPHARSSMWEDLQGRRRTEVDVLQGAVVALADALGGRAPVNAHVLRLVRLAEEAGAGSPGLSANDVEQPALPR